jgi:hypothetical protein
METSAPCGLYCGVCRIYLATQDNDLEYLNRLANVYARAYPDLELTGAQSLMCDGCQAERRAVFCRECVIRECTQKKRLLGCHQCDQFPCYLIDKFPMPLGKKVILRAIPLRRLIGDEAWQKSENERYHCPNCSGRLFRGAKHCPTCNIVVDVD